MAFPVLSTYRLQLRGADSGFGFTFADAEDLLDYLDDLGVSHLYLSPILTPVAGSAHGYDVTDPTTVSAELGGPEGLARLSAAARARGLGLIVDIVPNHVGVDKPEQNPGGGMCCGTASRRRTRRSSTSTGTWATAGWCCRCWVLTTTSPISRVDGDLLRLGDLALPIAPGTGDGTGPEVHDRQHYRLIGWRNGLCGYRRFFSITSLAGLRQEDRAVFDTSHAEVARWFADGLVDGVRIDHPDGLADPTGYLGWLRELIGPDAWIVIEKILAVDEALDPITAGGRHHRIRRTTRDRRGLRRSPRGAGIDGAGRIRRVRLRADRPDAGRTEAFLGNRDIGQRAGPVAALHRRGGRCRPPAAARRGGGAADPHRRLPQRLPAGWRRYCRPPWPQRSLPNRNSTSRCS